MPAKAFQFTIQLNIHAVTCPGVWLCPNNGKLTLCVFMLNCCGQTSAVPPTFPLVIHEKFVFNKTIHYARSLGDLEKCLNNEFLYCELVQWSPLVPNDGNVLANFQTRLSDLLYPSFGSKNMVAGVDVELLMEPCKCFPGIIAPKIEVSTKTSLIETMDKTSVQKKCPTSSIINPKTLRSNNHCRRPPIQRQKGVCHSDPNRGNFRQLRSVKGTCGSDCNNPLITSVRKIRDGVSPNKKNNPNVSINGLFPKWPCLNKENENDAKQYGFRPGKVQSNGTNCGFCPGGSSNEAYITPNPTSIPEETMTKTTTSNTCSEVCPVCVQYTQYFSDTGQGYSNLNTDLHARSECFQQICNPKIPALESSPDDCVVSASKIHERVDNVLKLELVHRTPKFNTNSSTYDNCCCDLQPPDKEKSIEELSEANPVSSNFKLAGGSDQVVTNCGYSSSAYDKNSADGSKFAFSNILESDNISNLIEQNRPYDPIDYQAKSMESNVSDLNWAYDFEDFRFNQRSFDYFGRKLKETQKHESKVKDSNCKNKSPERVQTSTKLLTKPLNKPRSASPCKSVKPTRYAECPTTVECRPKTTTLYEKSIRKRRSGPNHFGTTSGARYPIARVTVTSHR